MSIWRLRRLRVPLPPQFGHAARVALAATLLTMGLANGLLVVRSDALSISVGGVGVLLAAFATAGLAIAAARTGRLRVSR